MPPLPYSPSREDDGEGGAERPRRAEREPGSSDNHAGGAGNSDAHNTCRLAEELAAYGGGPALCLPFLQLGSAPRAAAMRIVLALLLSDEAAPSPNPSPNPTPTPTPNPNPNP